MCGAVTRGGGSAPVCVRSSRHGSRLGWRLWRRDADEGASGGKATWAGGAAVSQYCCWTARDGSGVGVGAASAAAWARRLASAWAPASVCRSARRGRSAAPGVADAVGGGVQPWRRRMASVSARSARRPPDNPRHSTSQAHDRGQIAQPPTHIVHDHAVAGMPRLGQTC